jgi:hypothetical protein
MRSKGAPVVVRAGATSNTRNSAARGGPLPTNLRKTRVGTRRLRAAAMDRSNICSAPVIEPRPLPAMRLARRLLVRQRSSQNNFANLQHRLMLRATWAVHRVKAARADRLLKYKTVFSVAVFERVCSTIWKPPRCRAALLHGGVAPQEDRPPRPPPGRHPPCAHAHTGSRNL